MFLLIPFLAGAGATGYLWYNGSKEEEPTLKEDVFSVLTPIFLIVLGLLFLRWLYAKGTVQKTK